MTSICQYFSQWLGGLLARWRASVDEVCTHISPSEPTPDHFRLVLAHLAFCAATIRALPSGLIVRFIAGVSTELRGQ
jgi:hypothetical protein